MTIYAKAGVILLAMISCSESGGIPSAEAAGDPIEFCKSVLDQGIRDTEALTLTRSNYRLYQATMCDSRYSNYSEAQSLAASGGLNIPGILGISVSDAQASSKYQLAWTKYCHAGYEEVKNDETLNNLSLHASNAILGSFNHCIDVLREHTVRYIKPSKDGGGFTIVLEKRTSGDVGNIELRGVDMLDTKSGKSLPLSNCQYRNKHLSVENMPIKSGYSNQLAVICKKSPHSAILVNVISSAGNLDSIEVPEAPPEDPTMAERVHMLEVQAAALMKSTTKGDIIMSTLPAAVFKASHRAGIWQLCDGNNGTPLTAGRYPRGFDDTLTPEGLGKTQKESIGEHTHNVYVPDQPKWTWHPEDHYRRDINGTGYDRTVLAALDNGGPGGQPLKTTGVTSYQGIPYRPDETRPKTVIVNFFCRVK